MKSMNEGLQEAAVREQCKQLHLPTVAAQFTRLTLQAVQQQQSHGSYMDAYNRRLNKGLSGSDVPHRLVVEMLLELPKFERAGTVNRLISGWKFGVYQTAKSGPTFTVITSGNTTNAFPAGRCALIYCMCPRWRTISEPSAAGSIQWRL